MMIAVQLRGVLAVALSCTLLAQTAHGASEVVVYSSVDDVFSRPIAERFEKQTGIRVKLVTNTEETKSTGLLNRLIAERARPQADVFWSGDPVRAAILKQRGIAAAYRSPAAAGIPPEFSDPEGYWTGFSARARVILYNATLVPAELRPKSVWDLTHSRFKARACIANPLFGTTSMHAAALFQVLGEAKARAFFAGMSRNGVRMLSSNGEVRRKVANGDCALGLTDTDDAQQAIRERKPVGMVYPDATGMGTLIVPNAEVLIQHAPHSNEARVFIDYLLSPEVEGLLAASEAAQIPVRAHVSSPASVARIDQLRTMRVQYAPLAQQLDALSRGFLKEWVAQAHR